MALKTTTEQLEAVQAAIEAVEAGQSWTQDGVSYTRASLAVLYAREEKLLTRLSRENGSRPMVSYAFTAGGGGADVPES